MQSITTKLSTAHARGVPTACPSLNCPPCVSIYPPGVLLADGWLPLFPMCHPSPPLLCNCRRPSQQPSRRAPEQLQKWRWDPVLSALRPRPCSPFFSFLFFFFPGGIVLLADRRQDPVPPAPAALTCATNTTLVFYSYRLVVVVSAVARIAALGLLLLLSPA